MKVSLGVVAYNEEKYLPELFKCIKAQDYPHEKIEILLIDSNSKDNTKKLMEEFKFENVDEFADIKVLDNLGQYISNGCNVLLKNYTGEYVCRIDAHAEIPEDFISKNIKYQNEGEKITGGPRPNIIDEETNWKKTLLIAEESRFGSGAAPYRTNEKKLYVTTAFHAMYKREVIEKVGLYDERFRYNEDNDYNQRVREAGFKICYIPEIISYEHIRPSFKQMLKQKFRNGFWNGISLKLNSKCLSLFHLVPFAFVIALIITIILTVIGFPWLLVAMMGIYIICEIIFTIIGSMKKGFYLENLLLPAIFFLMHATYGVGTLVGIFSPL